MDDNIGNSFPADISVQPDSQQPGFADLAPDQLLDAVDSVGVRASGTFLALNSYENRVYRVDLGDHELAAAGLPGLIDCQSRPVQTRPLRVVAKFYRPNRWSDLQILEEHQFTAQLAEAELPVITPLANNSGDTLFTFGEHRFALYPCAGGRAPELDNPEQLEQIGRLIGRIHAIGATESFQHRLPLSIDYLGNDARQLVLQSSLLPDYLTESYAAVTSSLLEQVSDVFSQVSKLDSIRLHGDLHPGNLLWNETGPHLVDFDDAVSGPAIQDLWMFLSGDRDYMNARLGDLLVGYEQFMEFDSRQLALIEALRTLRMIHHVSWITQRWSDPAFPIAFPAVGTTGFWEMHINTLQEQTEQLQQPPLIWD